MILFRDTYRAGRKRSIFIPCGEERRSRSDSRFCRIIIRRFLFRFVNFRLPDIALSDPNGSTRGGTLHSDEVISRDGEKKRVRGE